MRFKFNLESKATKLFNHRRFERITYQFGAFLLLLSGLCMPLGLHRVWVKETGWWIFPVLAALGMIGFAGHINHPSGYWKLLALPFCGIYVLDALMLCEKFYLSDQSQS
jgi:hypothetical protein